MCQHGDHVSVCLPRCELPRAYPQTHLHVRCRNAAVMYHTGQFSVAIFTQLPGGKGVGATLPGTFYSDHVIKRPEFEGQ
jgi:hypothetical protein